MHAEQLTSSFSGRHIVVTGGTGALGRAVVARLLEAGATITVPWIKRSEIDDLPFATDVTLVEADLTDDVAVRRLYSKIAPWASIHIAGGFSMSPVVDTTLDDVIGMFRLNALTCFLCARESIRSMRRCSSGSSSGSSSDRGAGGRIVNVGARPAVAPAGGMVAYTMSKAAVANLTQALAEEVKEDGILVNAVLPSIMDTPDNRKGMPDADHDEWPKVDEVAETIAWLASPANRLTSGALIPVYGRA